MMKKYIKPQLSVCKFDCEDIMTTSSSLQDTNGNFQSSWVESIVPTEASGSGNFMESWSLGK